MASSPADVTMYIECIWVLGIRKLAYRGAALACVLKFPSVFILHLWRIKARIEVEKAC
ncbi:hypothetical protein LZ32DRAFT_599084 [Colletotrichum eremochloae]|nr:hypothetical protein LZ32DRAFT_599084 [Colletotrichum eremochloae]